MKKMIPFLMLASAVAHAEIPEVRAKNVTCAEIQQTLASYSTITVVTKPFLFVKRLTVSVDIDCGAYADKTQAYFNTSDMNDCPVGFYCVDRVVYTPAPNPGPYHPNPNPGHHYPHPGPSYPGPSHPVPGPSHPGPGPSHGGGGHYNPPHGGEHGGHYNPPSGGHSGSSIGGGSHSSGGGSHSSGGMSGGSHSSGGGSHSSGGGSHSSGGGGGHSSSGGGGGHSSGGGSSHGGGRHGGFVELE